MFLKHYLALLIISVFFVACSKEEPKNINETQNSIEKKDIPKKIKLLFITQPHCPSCDALEETMKLNKPHKLIKNYFEIQKMNIGEKIPEGLVSPNGTPTVYFLGYKDEALVEPMVGEKDEESLMMFLNDALYEFKNLYGIDLQKKGENNETNSSKTTN
ncbi:MAG: hypothetical protein GXO60_01795 [Epsilonproteobacteria bacterium]|nr:hypothetical protein [Campylobacterota bacterium]